MSQVQEISKSRGFANSFQPLKFFRVERLFFCPISFGHTGFEGFTEQVGFRFRVLFF